MKKEPFGDFNPYEELALEDEHYKRLAYEQFTRLQKKAYPVVESNTRLSRTDFDRRELHQRLIGQSRRTERYTS